ncbi:hypothetical protein K505DRAFT_416571 [Melanomma pulvis-pyrius CBS 109.77]|uniref:DUF7137 domain-containing protein n=1 Tax=Melanomma pulvis-pyrius CBS 109.77 TaxID=1314802 RepID=A0A6A6XFQ7_9PLEO|nr:hypothetical protein K505DRAFT_416571 [Melanomma pulvis-pyrius CBS 109.77]
MRPSQLLAAAVAVSSVSAAWSDVFGSDIKDVLYGRGQEMKNVLYGRQEDNKSTTDKPSATQKDDTKSTSDAQQSDNNDKSTGKATGSQAKVTSTRTKKTQTTFAADLPAGGISMITPAAIAGPQYYKVGDWVTLAWNYTSLSITPSAIDIMATCTANQATYTLAVNQTVEKTGGAILWDTGAYQSSASIPLLTETYTLMIYDSESSPSAAPKPGYLGLANGFIFGMYTPQPYVPWSEFKCANCNSGLSAFETLTLKALLITSGTTIFSLLYFAASFGVW